MARKMWMFRYSTLAMCSLALAGCTSLASQDLRLPMGGPFVFEMTSDRHPFAIAAMQHRDGWAILSFAREPGSEPEWSPTATVADLLAYLTALIDNPPPSVWSVRLISWERDFQGGISHGPATVTTNSCPGLAAQLREEWSGDTRVFVAAFPENRIDVRGTESNGVGYELWNRVTGGVQRATNLQPLGRWFDETARIVSDCAGVPRPPAL